MERIGSLSKRGGSSRKSTRFNVPSDSISTSNNDETYVEVTLDIHDDLVAVHSITTATGDECEDPEVTLLPRNLEKKSSFGSTFIRNASLRIQQVSHEIKRLASLLARAGPGRIDKSKSAAAHALKGLKFISRNGDGVNGWLAVENRFDELAKDGLLPKSLFGQCIGMKESKEFAGELFDALARKRNVTGDSITKEELNEFWDQISDQSFDSRLQTFFDMVDKNADGRITEEKVREIISLSASANKLSKIQEQAEEYARLIMEELDPIYLGYIEIYNLETLLLQALSQLVCSSTSNSKNLSKMLSAKLKTTEEPNPLRRWYPKAKYFLEDNWQRAWVIALGIAIGVGLHAISHLTCDFPRLLHCSDQDYILMKPFFGDTKPNNYWWFVKGTEGWTGIVMVVLMTIAFTLATPWFR